MEQDNGLACHIVQHALGDHTTTVLKLSGYWQQLTTLGNALHACRSLTQLDLSRNGLTSLRGLQGLQQLRKLSLYVSAARIRNI